MQRAVEGQRGYGESVDYRGKPVVAAWSYFPSYRWGMVVKQDDGEAFALIYRQILVVTALLATTFLIVTAVALWLARTITRPIREAALVAERVASGDLTVSCEARAPGEVGSLLACHPQDDPGPSLADRQDPALEHHASSTATEIAATSGSRNRPSSTIAPRRTRRPRRSTRSRRPARNCSRR